MKSFQILIIFLSLCFVGLGQKKNTLKAFLDHKTFYSPSIGNYVEVHLQFVAYSINFKAIDSLNKSNLQGELAIQYLFKQNNELIKSDAYRLQSPIMRDSIIEDFYDVKRIPLKPGTYQLELNISDLNGKGDAITALQEIVVEDLSNAIQISSLETAETIFESQSESDFSKSGYEIIPRISNYYAAQANNIPVYLELYAPKLANNEKTILGLKQTIKDQKTLSEIESFTRFSKVEYSEIQPIIRLIDITKLYTGEYFLEYSLLDKENKEVAKKTYYFERFNDKEYESISTENIVLDPNFQKSITDDSLDYYISSLIPISKPAEIKNIISLLKTKDKDLYRKYIQSYWTNTTNGANVYEKWVNYKTQVMMVERLYATNFSSGHETDRGRVFLQYGPPSSVTTRETSPSEYPYEIWRYDKIMNMSNKRFVFYNPNLVNNTYSLLHSDMRGELQNYRWQQQLSKRNSSNTNIDDPNDGNYDHFGGNSNILYNEY
ncbi:MAG: GWxTD domain-containing protein [Flavobacteriia bacterium]|jgi:GWxTD domain-containing protein